MDKTMVNGITIIYDDSCLDKIDEIKETIKNNTEMFLSVMRGSTVLSLIPNEDETCAFLGVDEFDEFFMTQQIICLLVRRDLLMSLFPI